jgi:tetratricopeptide (TPR) repeat protein
MNRTATEVMDQALSHFSAVVAHPDSPAAHLNLAIWLASEERWDAAGKSYQQALLLDRQLDAARIGLGACLLKLNRPNDALDVFSQADGTAAWFGKAVALQLLDRFGEAETAYEMVLNEDPNSQEALANLVAMTAEAGNLERMREYSQKLLALAPQSPSALQGLVTVALERRDYHAAARYCDRLLELTPDCLEGWHNLRIALDRILSAFSVSKPTASFSGVK